MSQYKKKNPPKKTILFLFPPPQTWDCYFVGGVLVAIIFFIGYELNHYLFSLVVIWSFKVVTGFLQSLHISQTPYNVPGSFISNVYSWYLWELHAFINLKLPLLRAITTLSAFSVFQLNPQNLAWFYIGLIISKFT